MVIILLEKTSNDKITTDAKTHIGWLLKTVADKKFEKNNNKTTKGKIIIKEPINEVLIEFFL